MQFGIAFANTGQAVDPDGAAALASIAEENGFESIWAVEHVVVPAGYRSTYPYSPTGRMPGGEDSPIPDPLIWLTWVAAASTTLRLATGSLILPLRRPAALAKEVATLDVLSRGRVILGIGVGWLEEEFDALGVPFQDRGARTDEYITAVRALWRDDESTFHGRFVDFARARSYPKPVQADGIPIIVGGHTPPAARRAARLGDGFFPAVSGLDLLQELIGIMRSAAVEAGRDANSIGITAGGAADGGTDADGVRRLADMGVSRVVLTNIGGTLERWRRRLGSFADDVISRTS
jgi:probable F420-dependent oxidoreductase